MVEWYLGVEVEVAAATVQGLDAPQGVGERGEQQSLQDAQNEEHGRRRAVVVARLLEVHHGEEQQARAGQQRQPERHVVGLGQEGEHHALAAEEDDALPVVAAVIAAGVIGDAHGATIVREAVVEVGHVLESVLEVAEQQVGRQREQHRRAAQREREHVALWCVRACTSTPHVGLK